MFESIKKNMGLVFSVFIFIVYLCTFYVMPAYLIGYYMDEFSFTFWQSFLCTMLGYPVYLIMVRRFYRDDRVF